MVCVTPPAWYRATNIVTTRAPRCTKCTAAKVVISSVTGVTAGDRFDVPVPMFLLEADAHGAPASRVLH